MTQKTLYQTNDKPARYGHYLAENGDGRIVLLMSEGGYEDFDPKDLEEVLPYTIQLESVDGKRRHYAAPKGNFAAGDLVVNGCKLALVVAIDTKEKGVGKLPLNIRKVATVPCS